MVWWPIIVMPVATISLTALLILVKPSNPVNWPAFRTAMLVVTVLGLISGIGISMLVSMLASLE